MKMVLSILHQKPTSCDRITYSDSSSISSSWIRFLSDSSSGKYRSISSSTRKVIWKFLVANNCNKRYIKWYQMAITPTGQWSALSWLLFCTCEKGVAGNWLFGCLVLPGNTIKTGHLKSLSSRGLYLANVQDVPGFFVPLWLFLVSTPSDGYYCDIFIHVHDVQVLLLHPALVRQREKCKQKACVTNSHRGQLLFSWTQGAVLRSLDPGNTGASENRGGVPVSKRWY